MLFGAVACALTLLSSASVSSASAQTQEPVGAPAPPDPGGIERPEDPIEGQYIVTLRTSSSSVPTVADALADAHDGTVVRTYSHALSGFAVQMSEAEAQELSADPSVASVAQDGYVHATADQTFAPVGLDRIDQRDLPLDGSYT